MLGEHTRIIGVEAEAILAEAREELRLDLASPFVKGGYEHVSDETYLPVHSVVDALVRARLDVPVLAADRDDLGDLPRHVVADPEALELALLVELVHGLQRDLVRRRAVRAVQVPHIEGAVRADVDGDGESVSAGGRGDGRA